MSPKKCSAVLFCIFDLFSPLARSLARPCVARPPAPVGEALRRRSWFLSRVELSMSFALDFPTLPPSLPPSVRPRSDRDRGTAWSRPRPARARLGLWWTPGSGVQGQSGDGRLSLGWLLNRNLKAILTLISLRVDDKTLRVSTSESGVSIMSQATATELWTCEKWFSIHTHNRRSRFVEMRRTDEDFGFFGDPTRTRGRYMPSRPRGANHPFVSFGHSRIEAAARR